MDDQQNRPADEPAGPISELMFAEFPQPNANLKLDLDPPVTHEELALITWGGEGGGNLHYDPTKWGRRA